MPELDTSFLTQLAPRDFLRLVVSEFPSLESPVTIDYATYRCIVEFVEKMDGVPECMIQCEVNDARA